MKVDPKLMAQTFSGAELLAAYRFGCEALMTLCEGIVPTEATKASHAELLEAMQEVLALIDDLQIQADAVAILSRNLAAMRSEK